MNKLKLFLYAVSVIFISMQAKAQNEYKLNEIECQLEGKWYLGDDFFDGKTYIKGISAEVLKNWQLDQDARGLENATVEIEISLDNNGEIQEIEFQNEQENETYRSVAESAQKAINSSKDVFEKMAKEYPDEYNLWKSILITFNPQTYHIDTVAVVNSVSNSYCKTLAGEPVNGVVKDYDFYESGVLQSEIDFKEGKPNGIGKFYYESGALQAEANYKDGKENGLQKQYYESGVLKVEGNFVDDEPNGIAKFYYENGKLKVETNYVDGEQIGPRKEYYESGALKNGITMMEK